jgi:hypothetical protein
MFATTFYLFIMPNKYAKDANVHMIVTTLGKKKILLFSQYVMYIQRLYECTYTKQSNSGLPFYNIEATVSYSIVQF